MGGNVSAEQREERRREAGRLWARGFTVNQIARAMRCDWQTIRRDIDAITAEAMDEIDTGDEFRRLLWGAKEAEAQSWLLLNAAEKLEGPMGVPLRLGALSRVLAAQAAVLQTLTAVRAARADHRPDDTDTLLAKLSNAPLSAPARRRLALPDAG